MYRSGCRLHPDRTRGPPCSACVYHCAIQVRMRVKSTLNISRWACPGGHVVVLPANHGRLYRSLCCSVWRAVELPVCRRCVDLCSVRPHGLSASNMTQQPNGAVSNGIREPRKKGDKSKKEVKIVIVGDGGCGKTSLLMVYAKGSFPEVSSSLALPSTWKYRRCSCASLQVRACFFLLVAFRWLCNVLCIFFILQVTNY